MILYLLFPLLIIGIEESQTGNVTQDELSKVERNQTLGVSTTYNSTMTPDNVTSSLYRDEKSLIEEKLLNNETSEIISEDNEEFQDQENLHRHCDQTMLAQFSHVYCGAAFHKEMLAIGRENWCLLESITKPYSDLTFCLEKLSDLAGCYYPNSDTQDFFLYIHSHFFQNCTSEELLFEDAPHGLVMALTLIPVSLIPILVYVVVWKSKVQE
ncbi:receptor activity-modifying protein 1 [Trachinotus anak]|uniref:receptor activity-modifying protein 1 n=1 Tax=Trachinotus anak TaxID=443729 RepID=UPI0039F20EB3